MYLVLIRFVIIMGEKKMFSLLTFIQPCIYGVQDLLTCVKGLLPAASGLHRGYPLSITLFITFVDKLSLTSLAVEGPM